MQQLKSLSRERLASIIIIFNLLLVILTLMAVNILDVKVLNIELVDRGLYTAVTEKGNINIHPDNILRIEKTYTKAPLTGAQVELDKIYTDKGFIYLSSEDPFYEIGKKLMNSVDDYKHDTWEKPNTNWQTVRPYSYSIGTPEKQIPFLFFLLSLQYVALSLGGLGLAVLIFPFRFEDQFEVQPSISAFTQPEQDFAKEEKYNAIAK